MNKEKIKEISIQLQELIEEEVISQNTNRKHYDEFETFAYNFEYMLQEARDLLEDFKQQGLSVNTIEAEGYLRAF